MLKEFFNLVGDFQNRASVSFGRAETAWHAVRFVPRYCLHG